MDMAMNWSLYHRRESAAQIGTVSHRSIDSGGHRKRLRCVKNCPLRRTHQPHDYGAAVAPDRVVEQVIQTPPEKPVVESPKEVVPVTDAPAPAIQEKVQPPKAAEPQVQPKGNPDAENLLRRT